MFKAILFGPRPGLALHLVSPDASRRRRRGSCEGQADIGSNCLARVCFRLNRLGITIEGLENLLFDTLHRFSHVLPGFEARF